MANLKDVIYLSNSDYYTLATTGTVTIDSDTLTYDENNLYITPDSVATATEDGLMSASDKVKLDGIDLSKYLPLSGGTMTGDLVLNNSIHLNAKTTSNTSHPILYANDSNNIIFGNTAFGGIYSYNSLIPLANNSYSLGTSSYQWNNIYGKLLYENGTSLAVKYLGISATAADSSKLNGQAASYYLNYNNLTNKPTIPATNVIPATTTANKMLVSTTTSGTAKWSDWSSAGFLKTNSSGVISVDTNSYVLTSDVSSAGNAAANKIVSRSATGTIQSEKIAISSGTTTKATMQYNTTEDCIEFIFN